MCFFTACSKNFTGDSGRITSPGFPGFYSGNMNCNIVVTAPSGSTLALYFTQFSIERHIRCHFDYLKVQRFYLTTHSTHFIYGCMEGGKRFYKTGRRETVLFNDALNTFYLRLYGRRETVLFNDALNTFYLRLYGRRETSLFNDALNTFYLRLYGRREASLFNNALNTFYLWLYGRRETSLFNDALNTFYLRLYGRRETFL